MYEKAHLRSDFRKKYRLGWGWNPQKWLLSCSALSRMKACYIEFILVLKMDSKLSFEKRRRAHKSNDILKDFGHFFAEEKI